MTQSHGQFKKHLLASAVASALTAAPFMAAQAGPLFFAPGGVGSTVPNLYDGTSPDTDPLGVQFRLAGMEWRSVNNTPGNLVFGPQGWGLSIFNPSSDPHDIDGAVFTEFFSFHLVSTCEVVDADGLCGGVIGNTVHTYGNPGGAAATAVNTHVFMTLNARGTIDLLDTGNSTADNMIFDLLYTTTDFRMFFDSDGKTESGDEIQIMSAGFSAGTGEGVFGEFLNPPTNTTGRYQLSWEVPFDCTRPGHFFDPTSSAELAGTTACGTALGDLAGGADLFQVNQGVLKLTFQEVRRSAGTKIGDILRYTLTAVGASGTTEIRNITPEPGTLGLIGLGLVGLGAAAARRRRKS